MQIYADLPECLRTSDSKPYLFLPELSTRLLRVWFSSNLVLIQRENFFTLTRETKSFCSTKPSGMQVAFLPRFIFSEGWSSQQDIKLVKLIMISPSAAVSGLSLMLPSISPESGSLSCISPLQNSQSISIFFTGYESGSEMMMVLSGCGAFSFIDKVAWQGEKLT